MKNVFIVVFAMFLGATGFYFLKDRGGDAGGLPASPEKGFERVIKTGELRCGYQYWDGGLMRDENTGRITGAMAEIIEQMARNAELKVTWVGPIEWSSIPAALDAGKIDAWCAASWLDSRRGKYMMWSDPVAYNGLEAFVRGDDARFDKDPSLLDRPDVVLAFLENTASGGVSVRSLPRARRYAMMTGTDMDIFLSVVARKADVGFISPGIAYQYMKNNPGNLKRVRPDNPYAVMAAAFAAGNGDFRMLRFLNDGIIELRGSGLIRNVIRDYNRRYPGLFVEE